MLARTAAGAATPGGTLRQSPGVDPIGKVFQVQITRSEPCYQEREQFRPPSDYIPSPNVRRGFFQARSRRAPAPHV